MSTCTVAVLLYSDEYHELHRRCLESISNQLPDDEYELRIGMNEISDQSETWDIIRSLQDTGVLEERNIYHSHTNIRKYPLMRRMFHDPSNPITTPFVMWFDDDSYLMPEFGLKNWTSIHEMMSVSSMIGAVYAIGVEGQQKQWIEDQSWYAGKSVPEKIAFITGGWWCLDLNVIMQFDWPPAEFDHCGGDMMLGELLRQQSLPYQKYNNGVAINADSEGRESRAVRRGVDQARIGVKYDPGVAKQIHDAVMPDVPVAASSRLPAADVHSSQLPGKARLEEINDLLLNLVKSMSNDLKTFGRLRKLVQSNGDTKAVAKIILSEEDDGAGVEAQVATSPDLIIPFVSAQGEQITATWIEQIKPLVEEAVSICEQAKQ